MPNPDWTTRESLTVAETAQRLGVLPSTVRRWIRGGQLPRDSYMRVGPRIYRLFPDALHLWLQRAESPPVPHDPPAPPTSTDGR